MGQVSLVLRRSGNRRDSGIIRYDLGFTAFIPLHFRWYRDMRDIIQENALAFLDRSGDLVKHLPLGRDGPLHFRTIIIIALGVHDGESEDLAGTDGEEIMKGLFDSQRLDRKSVV